ncbi:hypothetical protein [Campylobacter sp.]|uniref:hypothetical protein n=1 Tax=Campylobacter sp. TaxID=205 RepID=UPI0026DC5D42|nr:hypothetical protein [Campylobacter sp.]MDO4674847.1 hypothetical protein [Campylobacter sp.]
MADFKRENFKQEIENLQYELNIVLEAMLLYAGAKRESLDEVVELYIDNADSVLENSSAQGVDEVLEVVDYLKNHHGEYFDAPLR